MNLEDNVCSIEFAKELKQLGIKQESYFEYLYLPHEDKFQVYLRIINELGYSAFMASELLALLPRNLIINRPEPFNCFKLRIEKSVIVRDATLDLEQFVIKEIYLINYFCDSTECSGENAWLMRGLFEHNIWDKNICNALAKTLIKIHKLENNNEIKNT